MVNLVNIMATATTIVSVVSASALFFQAYKIFINKSARDVSLIMFSMMCLSLTLWLLYGFAIKNLPIIIANMIAAVGAYITLFLILKFRRG